MKRVIVLSPWRGQTGTHGAYLRRCLRDCVLRGESPYASHRMLTEALDDEVEHERKLGMACATPWMEVAHLAAAYIDCGISEGMRADIAACRELGLEVVVRTFPSPEDEHSDHLGRVVAEITDDAAAE